MTTTSPSPRSATEKPRGERRRLPLHCDDLSSFAKALRRQLLAHHETAPTPPSHTQLLNMLARAAGHRNVQALQALAPLLAPPHLADEPAIDPAQLPAPEGAVSPPPPLSAAAAKALTQFDAWGRLSRWPHKHSVQRLAMWALWTRFDTGRRYTEREVNEILKAWTLYGDHVTPRRELINMGLLAREDDCSAYWKQVHRPSDEVQALLQALRARSRERLPRTAANRALLA